MEKVKYMGNGKKIGINLGNALHLSFHCQKKIIYELKLHITFCTVDGNDSYY